MAGTTPCAPPCYVRSVALVRNPPRMSAPRTCRARSGRDGAFAADAWANGDRPGMSAAMVTREFPWPRHLPDISSSRASSSGTWTAGPGCRARGSCHRPCTTRRWRCDRTGAPARADRLVHRDRGRPRDRRGRYQVGDAPIWGLCSAVPDVRRPVRARAHRGVRCPNGRDRAVQPKGTGATGVVVVPIPGTDPSRRRVDPAAGIGCSGSEWSTCGELFQLITKKWITEL